MKRRSATGLFVDTGAFYARFVENAPRHGRAMTVFDGIEDGSIPYRPLYTSSCVLSELATLLLRKATHAVAFDSVERIRRANSVRVIHPGDEAFAATCRSFQRYDDQQISFVDHASAVLADGRDVDHVFAFDEDFRTLGFTLVPEETAGDRR